MKTQTLAVLKISSTRHRTRANWKIAKETFQEKRLIRKNVFGTLQIAYYTQK